MRAFPLALAALLITLSPAGALDAPEANRFEQYHQLLLKQPRPGAIIERLVAAWLATRDQASLRKFLQARAEAKEATVNDRMVLGLALASLDDLAGALAAYGKALEADKSRADIWLHRAKTEAAMEQHAEALTSLDSLKQLGKNATPDVQTEAAQLKARVQQRSGDQAGALARLGELDKLLALEALILRHRGQKVCTTEPAISVVFCSRAAR